MTSVKTIPWTRIFAEGAAIVLSILLAFWIDAWWQDRQESKDRSAILSTLLAELKVARQNIEYVDRYFGSIRDSARTIVSAALAEDHSLTDRDVDVLLYEVTWYHGGKDLETPVLAQLARGDYSLISDVQLRIRLGAWHVQHENWLSDVRADYRFYRDRLNPHLLAHSSLPQIYVASNHTPGDPTETFPIEDYDVQVPVSHSALLDDQTFVNIVTERVNLMTNMLEWRSSDLEADLEEIIRLLKQELESL